MNYADKTCYNHSCKFCEQSINYCTNSVGENGFLAYKDMQSFFANCIDYQGNCPLDDNKVVDVDIIDQCNCSLDDNNVVVDADIISQCNCPSVIENIKLEAHKFSYERKCNSSFSHYFNESGTSVHTFEEKLYILLENDKTSFFDIAETVYHLKFLAHLPEDNISKFYKYCDDNFKLAKTSVKNYINIHKKFVLRNVNINYIDFSMSQLVEMLVIEKLDDIQKVKPSWTVKHIRDFAKSLKLGQTSDQQDKQVECCVDCDETVIKNETIFTIAKIKSAMKLSVEMFKYAKQDINVIIAFLCEKLNINRDEVVDMTIVDENKNDFVARAAFADMSNVFDEQQKRYDVKFKAGDSCWFLMKSGYKQYTIDFLTVGKYTHNDLKEIAYHLSNGRIAFADECLTDDEYKVANKLNNFTIDNDMSTAVI